MIRYSLACDEGHSFESWFRDSVAYEDQAARALVLCPTCQSTRVAKRIMAPALVGTHKSPPQITTKPTETAPPDVAPTDGASLDVALLDPRTQELRALLKSVRDKVIAEGQDVGSRFPDEARRMHDGKTPVRQIYGQASIGEARDLLEDGIMVLHLPAIPDDLN